MGNKDTFDLNEEYVIYKRCKVFPKAGRVFSEFGNELGVGSDTVRYQDENRRKHNGQKLRFVYEAVHGELGLDTIIRPKDNNPLNASIDNVEIHKRKEWFEKIDWSMKAVCDEATIKSIKDDYEAGVSPDGRRYTYRFLAKKYHVSLSTIQKILGGYYFNDKENNT